MLKVENISKQFKDFKLDNININLEEGFIMGLIGPSGSGKTTLIKLIMGLLDEDSGSISVFGKSMKENPLDIKNDIGFVYDNLDFYDNMKVKDYKKLNSIFYKTFENKTFDRYLERFEINKNSYINTLSKGQCAKLMLANALSHNAKLLILDEPTSGLDPVVRKEVMRYLQEFIEKGDKSVIISTHNTDELDKIADYVTFINKGELVFSTDKESLREGYKIIKGSREQIERMNTNVISKKHFKYFSEALVKIDESLEHFNDIKDMNNETIKTPNIEDIMCYYVEGDE